MIDGQKSPPSLPEKSIGRLSLVIQYIDSKKLTGNSRRKFEDLKNALNKVKDRLDVILQTPIENELLACLESIYAVSQTALVIPIIHKLLVFLVGLW